MGQGRVCDGTGRGQVGVIPECAVYVVPRYGLCLLECPNARIPHTEGRESASSGLAPLRLAIQASALAVWEGV